MATPPSTQHSVAKFRNVALIPAARIAAVRHLDVFLMSGHYFGFSVFLLPQTGLGAPVVILLPSRFPRLDFPPSRATGWPSSPPTVFRHAAGLTKALFIFL